MASRILKSLEATALHEHRWPEIEGALQAPPVIAVRPAPASETADADRLAELERQAEVRVREAFRKGEAAGMEKARREYEAAIREAAVAVRELAAWKPRLRKEAERDLVHLSLAIARRIIRRELTVDPAVVAGVVRAALDRLAEVEIHRLRVHPADVAIVSAEVSGFVEVAPDPSLPRGSAVFETARGRLDASIESQLNEIERGFADRSP
jgi:flagellar assembly protein FliH